MKYRFKPTNDITMYEIIEIVRASNFVIPGLVYEQMTRGHRHFELQPEDTLAEPRVNPLEPELKAYKASIDSKLDQVLEKLEEVVTKQEDLQVEQSTAEQLLGEMSVRVDSLLSVKQSKQSSKVNFGSRV